MSNETDKEALRREILNLSSQRDKIEREIKDWQAILKTVCEFVYLITIEIIIFEFLISKMLEWKTIWLMNKDSLEMMLMFIK